MKHARSLFRSLPALIGALAAAAACSSAATDPGTGGGANAPGFDAGSFTPTAPSEDSGTGASAPGPTTPAPTTPAPVSTPAEDAGSAMAGDAATCNIDYESFTFDTPPDGGTATHGVCDQCLTANCCDATVTCFNNNPDCLALDQCYQACDKQYPLGSGGGGGGTGTGGGGGAGTGGGGGAGTGGGGGAGTGGGGGAGTGDGGGGGDGGGAGAADAGGDAGAVGPRRACFNACDAAHPASTAAYTTFSACFVTTCKGSCNL